MPITYDANGMPHYTDVYSPGAGGGAATATVGSPAAPLSWDQRFAQGEAGMTGMANDIAAQEQQRYQGGLSTLTGAYNESRNALSSLIDPNLLFSQAADSIGARSRDSLDALRRSLGARGLNPNSGAAGGLLSRLMFQQQGGITGATQDIAIENQKRRQVAAAQNFANALSLAGFQNSPVSGIQYENAQNLYEGNLARYGIDKQAKSTKNAQKTSLLGGLLGAGSSILGGLL